MKKPKQVHKTKAELIVDLKNNKDWVEKMKFTREVFYPALCKASKNIDDAISFLGSINTVMMEIFLGFMKTKMFGELDIISKLDPKDEKYAELVELMKLFEDKSVFDAKSLFEGMRQEIQLFTNEELKERSLDTLKTKWIDEL